MGQRNYRQQLQKFKEKILPFPSMEKLEMYVKEINNKERNLTTKKGIQIVAEAWQCCKNLPEQQTTRSQE